MFILGLQIVLFCLKGLFNDFLGILGIGYYLFLFLIYCFVWYQVSVLINQLCSELIFCNLMNDLCVF